MDVKMMMNVVLKNEIKKFLNTIFVSSHVYPERGT